MDLRQFLTILRARMHIIIAVLIVTVGVATVVSYLMPKKYTAAASVVIDAKPDPINGLLQPVMPGYLATQVDIITSKKVALEAVKTLKLADNPVAKEEFEKATGGRGTIENWLADLLLRGLKVDPARESSVINITYSGNDPDFAKAVADAFSMAYINTNLELRVQPARQSAVWFNGQSKALRDNLENAQAKLSQYQRDHGIVSSDEQLDMENGRLLGLSQQLVGAQSVTYESQSRERKAKELIAKGASADELAEVLTQPLIVNLKGDVSRSEARLRELESQYGKNHPQYLQAQAQLAELKSKLASETVNVTKGMTNSNVVNERREADIRGALDAQRKRVLAIKAQRDEMAVLMREVDAAQKAFDAVTQRLTQTSLESQTNQTNIAILNPAVAPLVPSSPRILLNIALSIIVGMLLGVGAAVGLELADRRIRNVQDLKLMLNLPVLGVLPKTGSSRQWLRLPKGPNRPALPRIEPAGVK